ncbi:MAG: UDP-4-amino-4,6-dideoxy-N-acetyl-beta-L-altrosamine transaminase [Candidatus Vogelbacteria bacterium]|nr:UDP-4-amino-4,6-dideoxy-N-acetyl-beta-L-altrosamine transaminase [Candidatus Vogelbacteria bacterium]
MIPYGRQFLDRNDKNEVLRVLSSDWLTQGPEVFAFEQRLCKYTGAKYAVAVSSGTAALHIAYLAAGIGPGDEVITTPNTFVATSNMILAVGAKPIFCDINIKDFNIDDSKIESLINKRTQAIVPVDFAGRPCVYKNILKIAKKYNLLIIEDACHALGAEYGSKKVGNIANMTVFSFHPVKSITTGEGGAVLTNDKLFFGKLKLLRSHGVTKDKIGFNVMKSFGYNYRISDIQCGLGLSQMRKLDKFIARRSKLVSLYRKHLGHNSFIVLPVEDEQFIKSANHLFVIRVKDKKYRMPLYNFLKDNGVGVNFHYPPIYSHPFYKRSGFNGANCEAATTYGKTAITLPLYYSLKSSDIAYISEKISDFFATQISY